MAAIFDVVTAGGTIYRLDFDESFWMRFPSKDSRSPNLALGIERMRSFKVGTAHNWPWNAPDAWVDGQAPELGKHMFVSSGDVWYVSREVIEVIPLDSWDAPLSTPTGIPE